MVINFHHPFYRHLSFCATNAVSPLCAAVPSLLSRPCHFLKKILHESASRLDWWMSLWSLISRFDVRWNVPGQSGRLDFEESLNGSLNGGYLRDRTRGLNQFYSRSVCETVCCKTSVTCHRCWREGSSSQHFNFVLVQALLSTNILINEKYIL